jgi:CheY-like chemotaxis protein
LVEDNNYMRSMLAIILKALGVENVKLATHGGEAIEVLKLMQLDPQRAGLMSVDMILSNWEMSPVDGLILLRWVRRHKESPDRFIPFVMVTGYADKHKVAESRDLGVTEMLAKPYSLDNVAERLMQVVEKPRQFVHTSTYFGPGRRRRAEAFSGKERRVLVEGSEYVEVVYD